MRASRQLRLGPEPEDQAGPVSGAASLLLLRESDAKHFLLNPAEPSELLGLQPETVCCTFAARFMGGVVHTGPTPITRASNIGV